MLPQDFTYDIKQRPTHRRERLGDTAIDPKLAKFHHQINALLMLTRH
jgi:hypothetical protein